MTSEEPNEDVPLDTLLEVLANKYRRRLLTALLEHNPQDDDDAQLPADVTIEDEDLANLKEHMTHVHLPKLVDAGLIEWDQEANVLQTGPRFNEIRPLLQLMYDHADELPDDWI
ncbi:DUF7344 domain-containing protein [Haladaptatus sp. NG-SE-30]